MSLRQPDSALVIRWLCHDMATPIATLVTASELLSEQSDHEINELITAAIRKLSARLRLVRLAMGSQAMLSPQALEKLLTDALQGTTLSLTWPEDCPIPANVIAGAALIMAELGGPTSIILDANGARWCDDRQLPEAATAALATGRADDARNAMVALVAGQVERAGWRLTPCGNGLAFEAG
jgi:hypothetical protein